MSKEQLNQEITRIINQNNNSYHRAIKMTLNAAWVYPENSKLKLQNSSKALYNREFSNLKRELVAG